ncbi:Serine/threonine-protein phosphatase 7 long form [Glycine max]|nr:Serine/threonine-protein phosphatase 7 long form [Glycine max]
MYVEYIGVVPPENALVGSTLKLKWLKEHMLTLPVESTPQQLTGHCRACILELISGVLIPYKSRKRVHLMYLPLLAYFDRIGQYN